MIIDTHVHLLDGGWLSDFERCPSAEELIETQDRMGIREMWISSVGALAGEFAVYNRLLYEVTKNYPERFRCFGAAGVYQGKTAVLELEKCIVEYGFKGIKMHYWMQGGSVHSPATHEIMELSAKYRVPVMFHDGTPPACDTLQIAFLAGEYPEAAIILGHSGLLDSYRSAIEACNAYDNIYLCLSASPTGDVREICKKVNTERLLFGSDFGAGPSDDLFIDRRDAVIYGCEDKETRERIFFRNALALTGREGL